MNELQASRFRQLYNRTAPALALICILLCIFAVAGTYWNDRVNRRQDSDRIADTQTRANENARLLGCFDSFATTLAGGLPKVREASAARNAAQSLVFQKLGDLLTAALSPKPPTGDDAAAIVKALADSLDQYRTADAHLLQVQADNPYPDPPSKFCDDLP